MDDDRAGQREALKRTAVALKQADLPFALCGGYAAWAHGAPEPEHDVDFVVAADDAPAAVEALRAAGLEVEQPPEDWLVKVWSDGAMVDVIHRTAGREVGRPLLHRAQEMEVLSVAMPVLPATDVLAGKLLALNEHACDFARLLPVARALREQVDWPHVARAVAGNDFAVVFLALLDRLGVVPAAPAQPPATDGRTSTTDRSGTAVASPSDQRTSAPST